MINVNTIHILVIYTICYGSLIIQKKYTFIFNKSCINQIIHFTMLFFYFQYFTISNQFKYAHKFNSVMQFNSFFFSIQFSSVNQFCYATLFSYANQFSYANKFSYALNKFNLCLRYMGYQSHRHGPAGLQAGIRMVL